MNKQIIIDVKTSNKKNKVDVRENTKKDKYQKLFSGECKTFVTSLARFVESLFKVFFYGLVIVGLLFQEWGKKKRARQGKEEKDSNKLF